MRGKTDIMITKIIYLIAFLFSGVIISCASKTGENKSEKANVLTGTWKLIEYSDFDSASGKWVHPYGNKPRGYFTYTNSGVVNLSVSSETPLPISSDSAYKSPLTLGALLDNAVSYFGTYTIDFENSTVTHHPTGGAIPWYVGTDQHRQFTITGDTLQIGDPTFTIGKRVLIRVD
jgi:lipocalin-like protein